MKDKNDNLESLLDKKFIEQLKLVRKEYLTRIPTMTFREYQAKITNIMEQYNKESYEEKK